MYMVRCNSPLILIASFTSPVLAYTIVTYDVCIRQLLIFPPRWLRNKVIACMFSQFTGNTSQQTPTLFKVEFAPNGLRILYISRGKGGYVLIKRSRRL